MKKMLLILCVSFLALFLVQPTYAFNMTFFGEDEGLGDHNGQLTSHPNSDAARADFFSYLTGVGTEDFETGFSHGQSVAAGTAVRL